MDLVFIAFVSLLASLLTFFSGFGLGTLLMPAISLFFPLPIAIAITAIVHFSNNLLKFFLLVKHSNLSVLMRFGIPAIIFAFIGASSLEFIDEWKWSYTYTIHGVTCNITFIKLIIGCVIALFLIVESTPKLYIPHRYKKLWIGGALSGFFGGLSGHQGAFRSLFLTQNNFSKEIFLATGVSIAVLVDMARLTLYLKHMNMVLFQWDVILVSILSAFLGTFIGKEFLKKTSIEFIRLTVSWMLGSIAFLLIIGFL